MITEDYCSATLLKLLKDKGFPFEKPKAVHGVYIPAVSLSRAMKWLRGKDVDIIIMPLFKLKGGRIYCYEIHSDNTDIRTGQFKTYEEAVEAALKYSLENLI